MLDDIHAQLDIVVSQLAEQATHASSAEEAQAAMDRLEHVIDAVTEIQDAQHDLQMDAIHGLHASDTHGVEVAFADPADDAAGDPTHALQQMDANDRDDAQHLYDAVHDVHDTDGLHAAAPAPVDAAHHDLADATHDASGADAG